MTALTPEAVAASPGADTFREMEVGCDNCRFAYHWAETRHRWEPEVRGRWLFRTWRDVRVPYQATGIQCFRYPTPTDTESDYWCGEYQVALLQADPRP